MEARYVARKRFKYGSREYYPGDPWKPTGGKWDKKLIDTNMVRLVVDEQPAPVSQEVTDDEKQTGSLDEHSGNNRSAHQRVRRDRHSGVHPNEALSGNIGA